MLIKLHKNKDYFIFIKEQNLVLEINNKQKAKLPIISENNQKL